MSRSKKDPRNGIADRDWIVYDSYEFSSRRMQRTDTVNLFVEEPTIIRTSEKATSYSLCNPDLYIGLLEKYLNINDKWEALEYVKQWGFPSSDSVPKFDSLQEEGFLLADLLHSAAYLRWLDFLSGAINGKEIRLLNHCVKETKSGIYFRHPNGEPIVPFETNYVDGRYRVIKVIEEPLLYASQELKKQNAGRILYLAQKYLKYSLNRLLRGVQPILDWGVTADGDWILDEYMLVETPWQAICYALLLNITGKTRLVSCPRCSIRFRPNHKGHHYCSGTCTRAHSNMRNKEGKGPRFNKYPKTRKGKGKGNDQKKI